MRLRRRQVIPAPHPRHELGIFLAGYVGPDAHVHEGVLVIGKGALRKRSGIMASSAIHVKDLASRQLVLVTTISLVFWIRHAQGSGSARVFRSIDGSAVTA